MAKLILLNGPANCGKSIAVDYLKQFYVLTDRRCKDKLFKLTQELFCVDERMFWDIYNDRAKKELPNPNFKLSPIEAIKLFEYLYTDGSFRCVAEQVELSIREAMIYVSEIICKPAFGEDYFGKARVEDMLAGELAVDDSCGFVDELGPAIDHLGQDNILLIRIFGRGDFSGDSRGYIPEGVIDNTVDVFNIGKEKDYLKEVEEVVEDFINEKPLTNRKPNNE